MNAIAQIFAIIPAIIQAIKAIEAAIPGSGQGQAKLDAVLQILETVDGTLKPLFPQITAVIGVLVGLFNKTGTFAK